MTAPIETWPSCASLDQPASEHEIQKAHCFTDNYWLTYNSSGDALSRSRPFGGGGRSQNPKQRVCVEGVRGHACVHVILFDCQHLFPLAKNPTFRSLLTATKICPSLHIPKRNAEMETFFDFYCTCLMASACIMTPLSPRQERAYATTELYSLDAGT